MNVAIYLRKSREEFEESREETLARHERILFDYCSKNNLIIKEIYKEVVSGESIANRPKMQILLEDVRNNLYDGIVCIELERLSRGNQIDQAEILEIFKKSNTKIFTLNKIYDLSDEDNFDEEFFEFGLFMSRREYKVIKRRLIRGRLQAQKEGYFIGSTLPYGYSKEYIDRGYVLVPNEQSKIVKLIFDKYVNEDLSVSKICDYLDNLGIKTAKSCNWNVNSIRRILKSKTYCGYLQTNTSGESENVIWIKGKHEPIIDDILYEKASIKLKSKAPKNKKGDAIKNPLSSICRCAICGYTMKRAIHPKQDFDTFKCSTRSCKNISSNLDHVEKKVIEELKRKLKDFKYYMNNYSDEIDKKKESIKNEKQLLLNEILKKEKMIEKACEMLEEGIYTKEKYLSRVNILESDLSALKSNLESLNDITFDEAEEIKNYIPKIELVLEEYWNLSPANKNKLLKTIVGRIDYLKDSRKVRLEEDNLKVDVKLKFEI